MRITNDTIHTYRRTRLTGVLACAALALAACGKGKEGADTTAAMSATDTTAAGNVAVSPSAGATTTAGTTPAAAAADTGKLSDANIIAKMEGGDSSEIQVASLARTKATNAGVKSYAEMLVSDHGKALTDTKKLATSTKITPQAPPGDTTAQMTSHLLDRFKGLAKGAAFDTAFVNHEVEDHQHDIDETKQMGAQAQNSDVKNALNKSLPTLQKHLDRAQQLQKTLGATK